MGKEWGTLPDGVGEHGSEDEVRRTQAPTLPACVPTGDLRTLVPHRPEDLATLRDLLETYGLFCEANLAASTV